MKEPDRAAAIIREIKQAIGDTPLSIKIRLGWSDPDDFKKFIPVVEEAGAQLITIHGRTKAQGYAGKSDWARIAEAKKIARVPLLANGDIHEPHQVKEALEITGADGVLIARGALGNPWFFKLSNEGKGVTDITMAERVTVILEHARLHIAQYGERGLVTFRKHLAWYLKSSKVGFEVPGIKDVRTELMKISTYAELETHLAQLLK